MLLHLLLVLVACGQPPSPPEAAPPRSASLPVDPGRTVLEGFPAPEGATRVSATPFASYLRALPLRPPEAAVHTHDGALVTGHRARVIDLPLVKGDLQQCADSIIRVRAEYLRDGGAEVAFHATSGDLMPWSRYQAGERAYAEGPGLKWRQGEPATWDRYLSAVFMWAGTASLATHDTVPDDHPDPGDILVQGGFPGHAVLILDVAESEDETYLLVAEGFMPAQDFHVELGPAQGWWPWSEGVDLPHWPLPREALRTWK